MPTKKHNFPKMHIRWWQKIQQSSTFIIDLNFKLLHLKSIKLNNAYDEIYLPKLLALDRFQYLLKFYNNSLFIDFLGDAI